MSLTVRQAVLRVLHPGDPYAASDIVRAVRSRKDLSWFLKWRLDETVGEILKDLRAEGRVKITPSRRDPDIKMYSLVYGVATLERKPVRTK